MTTALKLRRGTTAQHSTFTGAAGEVTVDTTKKTVVVHDGATAGGFPVLKEANPSYSGTLTGGTGVVNLGSGQVYKDASGNVGLGTTSPGSKLVLNGSDVRVHITDGTNSLLAGLWDGVNNRIESAGRPLFITSYNTAVVLGFGGSEAFRVHSNNNVGIGYNSPSYKLDVSPSISGNFVARISNQSGVSATDHVLMVESNTASSARIISARNAGTERFAAAGDGKIYADAGYGSAGLAFMCRVWVNFNGTGTVAIRKSGNVSSITDTGTGDYTVNFTNAMPDASYAVAAMTTRDPFAAGTGDSFAAVDGSTATTTSCRIYSSVSDAATNSSLADRSYVSFSLFR